MKAFYSILFLALFISCSNSASKQEIRKNSKTNLAAVDEVPKDTSQSFRINNLWAAPKKQLSFNSLLKAGEDTLSLAICGDYVYSPFGPIKDKSKFKSSLLKNFVVTIRADTTDVGREEFQILNHGSSKLIFFFDHGDDAETTSDIFKGRFTIPTYSLTKA